MMRRPSDIAVWREATVAALAAGDYDAAVASLQPILDAGAEGDGHLDVVFQLAHGEAVRGNWIAASSVLHGVVGRLRAQGSPHLARALIQLGCLSADSGDPIAAVGHFDEAEEQVDAGDWYTLMRLRWARARLSGDLGDTDGAIADIEAVVDTLDRSEDTFQAARARILASTIYLRAGDVDRADAQLRLAEHAFPQLDAEDRVIVLANRARIDAAVGDPAAGMTAATTALRIAAARDAAGESRAWWAIAECQTAIGDVGAADAAFARALTLSTAEDRFALAIIESWLAAIRDRSARIDVIHDPSVDELRREVAELRRRQGQLRNYVARVRGELDRVLPPSPRPVESDRRARRGALRPLDGGRQAMRNQ